MDRACCGSLCVFFNTMNATLQAFFSSKSYHAFISAVILLNCLVLGLDTSEFIKASGAKWLEIIDKACLAVFVVELGLKIYAFKLAFFTGKDSGMPLTSSSWL